MFRAIEERGGIVKVHNRVGNVGQMAGVVGEFPGITWIIDHMMYPEPWMAGDGWTSISAGFGSGAISECRDDDFGCSQPVREGFSVPGYAWRGGYGAGRVWG